MARSTASDADAARLRRIVGDPREVAGDLERVRKAAQKLSSDHPRLIEQYPEQWVAVFDDAILAADSLESLLQRIDEAGVPREDVVVRFISKDERVLIL